MASSLRSSLQVFFITGKGPCKEAFVRAFEDLRLSNIKLYTPWLSVLDYPLLLGVLMTSNAAVVARDSDRFRFC